MTNFGKLIGLGLMLLVLGFSSVPDTRAQNGNMGTMTTRADRDDDTDWGWIGLLGLLGLAGLMPKKRAVDHDRHEGQVNR